MTMVEIDIDDVVATVTMNRPEKRNAVSDEFIAELDAAFTTMLKDGRVVILIGAGGHYCAGLDLAEHADRFAEKGIYHSGH